MVNSEQTGSTPVDGGEVTEREHGHEQSFVGHPPRRRLKGISVIVPLAVMAVAVGGLGVAWTQVDEVLVAASQCTPVTPAEVVPSSGVLMGVNLDWERTSLEQHRANLGHAPAVVVQFSDIPYDDKTWQHTISAVDQMKENGGVLLLTLEPHAGLDAMSDDVIDKLATDLRDVNLEGVPVVLRFAHEMNGSWYAWGQQPAHYIEVFREVAAAVHETAPGTAMMWAPNYGGGYPFTGGQFAARPGTSDYAALDTNGDGAVTMEDDTYAPYFPGDEAVDWVGVSLYHWGNQRPWGDNDISEPGKFVEMLTGTYSGTAGDDAAIPDFYNVYGVEHGHPVAIPETAAIFTPSRDGASELDVKSAWWSQVFADEVHRDYPQLKMINWFEWSKYEIEINDDVDWRAAGSPAIRDEFVSALPSWLLYSEHLPTCGER